MTYNYASFQPQAFTPQAWLPPDPLPFIPPNDAVFASAFSSTTVSIPVWLENTLAAWTLPDPLPTLPNQKTPQGLGASIVGPGLPRTTWFNTVLSAWVPPDPNPTLPSQQGAKVFTPGGIPITPPAVPGNKVYPPKGVLGDGAVPVYLTYSTPTGALTPTGAGTQSRVSNASGVIAATGPLNGGFIINPNTSGGQGLGSTENLYVDFTKFPGNTDATANGTTTLIPAGNNPPFYIPALPAGVNVYVNAPTVGHLFTIVVW